MDGPPAVDLTGPPLGGTETDVEPEVRVDDGDVERRAEVDAPLLVEDGAEVPDGPGEVGADAPDDGGAFVRDSSVPDGPGVVVGTGSGRRF